MSELPLKKVQILNNKSNGWWIKLATLASKGRRTAQKGSVAREKAETNRKRRRKEVSWLKLSNTCIVRKCQAAAKAVIGFSSRIDNNVRSS